MEQMTLEQYNAEIKHKESHGSRGKMFERMLNAAHKQYAQLGIASIYNIPNAFDWCSEEVFSRTPPQRRARMGDGRTLRRIMTPFDYIGTIKVVGSGVGRVREPAIAFAADAKQFSGARISLDKFEAHQIEGLALWHMLGALAGFLVYAVDTGRCYWLTGLQVRDASDKARHQLKGQGKHPKTLTHAWLDEHALLLGIFRPGQAVLWVETLTGMEAKS
jgi:penicillin-binding protein-related factor A (putative recombinase)